MSQSVDGSREGPHNAISLATAIASIGRDHTLTRQRRHGICSGLRSYARIMRRSPEAIHISPDRIRPTLRALTPPRTGLSASRVATIKTSLGFVMQYFAVGEGCRPRGGRLSAEFSALLSMTDDRWHQIVLRRFFAYCTSTNISPSEVTTDVLDRFGEYLKHSTLASRPSVYVRSVRRVWNKCSRQYPLWPKQTLEVTVRRGPAEPQKTSVECDIERYGMYLSGTAAHPASGACLESPLRRSSLRVHLGIVRRCASMVAGTGLTVASLRDLCTPEAVGALKSALYGHEPPFSPPYIHQHLLALQQVASRWGMTSIDRPLSPAVAAARTHETSPRKFRQIIELIETGSFERLLALPEQLMAQALLFEDGSRRRIAGGQLALALELMTMVPISPGQLTAARVGDVLESPSEPASARQLTIIVRSLFKPRASLRYSLPDRTGRLFYIYRDRVLHATTDREWLFPSPAGETRHPGKFGEAIKHTISKYVGIEMICGALRFLGGTVYLLHHPRGYEVVRRAMGYSSIAHTRRMFSFVRIVSSFNKFDSLVAASTSPKRERHTAGS